MTLFPVQNLYEWYRQVIRNPKYRWWIIGASLAYVLSPFDIAPDFLPIIGQIDDVMIMTLLVSEVSQIVLERVKAAKGVKTADPNSSAEVEVDAVEVN